jgi:hypothetical protein
VSEHEHTPDEEEAQEPEEVKDLDVPEEESKDIKGGLGRRGVDQKIN